MFFFLVGKSPCRDGKPLSVFDIAKRPHPKSIPGHKGRNGNS